MDKTCIVNFYVESRLPFCTLNVAMDCDV